MSKLGLHFTQKGGITISEDEDMKIHGDPLTGYSMSEEEVEVRLKKLKKEVCELKKKACLWASFYDKCRHIGQVDSQRIDLLNLKDTIDDLLSMELE